MKRANVLGTVLVVTGALAGAAPAGAQAIGADASLYSSYVWRGLSLTNKPVLQPDLYVTFPLRNASVTVGGWANIDLGQYDDPDDDISESGGLSSFNFAEFDPWAEISFPLGEKLTLTGGVTAYIYPNDAGLTSDFNTVELYGKAALDVLLSPKLNFYYDVDKIDGAYIEGSVSHTLQLGEKVGLALGALAGFSEGQDADLDAFGNPQADFFNFVDNGLTHVDLSAGLPLTAGVFSITPSFHFVITGDDATKVQSPTNLDEDYKVWGGVTVSWSKDYGESAEEGATEAE